MPHRRLSGLTRADIAFRAEGGSLEQTFRAAWEATLEVMLPNPNCLRALERRLFELANPEPDLLLFDFLQQLLFFKDAEGLLLRLESLSIEPAAEGFRLRAEAAGEAADPARHELGTDVKAVTLHRFRLRQTAGRWQATVILDV
jgi:SHS2 domain-containing protein